MRCVVVFDLWLYRVVPPYFQNGTIDFLYNFCRKHHSKKSSACYCHTRIYVFMQIIHYYCQILLKLQFFLTVFRKILRYNFPWKSAHCELSCSVRSDRHGMTKLMVTSRNFCERALKWIFQKWVGEGMDWIDLAQDRNRWRALLNTVINLRVP